MVDNLVDNLADNLDMFRSVELDSLITMEKILQTVSFGKQKQLQRWQKNSSKEQPTKNQKCPSINLMIRKKLKMRCTISSFDMIWV